MGRTRDGLTAVVEPKPHWAEDMRVFRLDAREYCRYAEWTAHGGRARFYGHIDTSGDDLMMAARDDRPRNRRWALGLKARSFWFRTIAWNGRSDGRPAQLHHAVCRLHVRASGSRSWPEGNTTKLPAWRQGWHGRASAISIRHLSDAMNHPRFHSQTLSDPPFINQPVKGRLDASRAALGDSAKGRTPRVIADPGQTLRVPVARGWSPASQRQEPEPMSYADATAFAASLAATLLVSDRRVPGRRRQHPRRLPRRRIDGDDDMGS